MEGSERIGLEHGERAMEKCMRVVNLSLSLLLCALLPVHMAVYMSVREYK